MFNAGFVCICRTADQIYHSRLWYLHFLIFFFDFGGRVGVMDRGRRVEFVCGLRGRRK